MARITFLATQAFEKWCHLNPDLIGVGNSETDCVTKSAALAARGHDVTVYAPIPDACPTPHKGVHWKPIEEVRWNTPGVWVLSRCPQALDALHGQAAGQKIWLVCQDEDYPDQITPERAAKLHRVVTLCRGQELHWKDKYPFLADKVCRGSNGLRADLVREALAEPIERDQFRINYASSPDRALEPLVKVFRRAREFEPRLSLHVYYGRDNLDKVKASAEEARHDPKAGAARLLLVRYARLERLLTETKGLVWHGRTPQPALYREWCKAGLNVYPCSHFRETGPIHGDSLVETLAGPVPIRALAGKSGFEVYSCDANGDLSASKVKWCGLKRRGAAVIKLRFRPGVGRNAKKEKELTLTPDHEVMLRDGTYVRADQLKPGDRVKAFHNLPNGWGKGYATVGLTDRPLVPAHRFVASRAIGRDLVPGEVVDHLDGNTRNNAKENLAVRASQSEHVADHWARMSPEEREAKEKENAEKFASYHASLTPEELSAAKAAASKAYWDSLSDDPEARADFVRRRNERAFTPEVRSRRSSSVKAASERRFGKSPWRDKDTLHKLYVEQGLSAVEIGEQLGCADFTIGTWLRRHGIPVRDMSECQTVRRSRAVGLSNHVVVATEQAGTADVYCMEVEPDHNFVANGIVVHNCVTLMESQALGAVPIVAGPWAVREHTLGGVVIHGDCLSDPLTIARFVQQVVAMSRDAGQQEKIRQRLMPLALSRFDNERFAEMWHEWAVADTSEAAAVGCEPELAGVGE